MLTALRCLFALDGEELGRIRRDYLVFRIRGNDFYRHMLEAGEEEPLPHPGLKQQVLFFIGKVERILQHVNGRWRLFQEKLNGGVRKYRPAIWAVQEVFDVLRNGCEPG